MSEEGFLKRWSRRKHADAPPAEAQPAEHPASEHPPQQEARATSPSPIPEKDAPKEAAAGKQEQQEDAAFDPASLPPLESLGPGSDYTAFLKKGVPEAIKLAALRKAWMTDPAIRDFPSPAADYGWDFNTPEYLLRPTDDVEKMLDKILPRKPAGEAPADSPAPAEAAPEPAAAKPDVSPDLRLPQNQAEPVPVAPARETEEPASVQPRRKHGGALPD